MLSYLESNGVKKCEEGQVLNDQISKYGIHARHLGFSIDGTGESLKVSHHGKGTITFAC